MSGWTKRLFRISLVALSVALLGLVQSARPANALDVSDPAGYLTETFSENVGWRPTSVYPRERSYTFFSGAEGSLELTLSSPWLRYLGLALLDANGRTVEARDLYYRGSPYRTVFYVHPALYTIRIRGDLWGACADYIPYGLTLKHPQSAPQIELSAPADTAVVSHNIELGVKKKELPSNPEISSVEMLLGGNAAGSSSEPPYSFNLDTDLLPNAFHSLEFRAYDADGRYNPLSSSIEVKNVSPYTRTESVEGRIGWGSALLYPRLQTYSIEMRRSGMLNAAISGDWRLRYLSWILKDGGGAKMHYHDFYYEGTHVRRSIYLAQGSYALTIFDSGFYGQEPFIPYVLTLDYPARRKIIDRLAVAPTVVDPSEDPENTVLGSVLITYDTLEDAYLTLEIESEEGETVRRLLARSPAASGTHLSAWDGLDDEGNIADEGVYRAVLASFDNNGVSLDSASATVEVIYHTEM